MDKRQQAIDFLMTIREGALLDEIYDTCVEATVAAVDRGKNASVAVTFSFVPVNDAVQITGLAVPKLPAVKRKSQTFFPRAEGLPSRRDERQAGLFDSSRPRVVVTDAASDPGKAANE